MITVIIPTFNIPAEWLSKAIHSVIHQDFKDLEIIVIDDNSSIPFSGVSSSIRDERIKWIKNEMNRGVSASRNLGAELASGEWLAFLDADDWWDKEKLTVQYNGTIESGCRWSYVSANIIDKNHKTFYVSKAEKQGNISHDCLKEFPITGSVSSVLIEKEFFEQIGGFDTENNVVEDWDLWIRCAEHAEILAIDQPLVSIRILHNQSRSRNAEKQIQRIENLLAKHESKYKKHDLISYMDSHISMVKARHAFLNRAYIDFSISVFSSLVKNPKKFINTAMVILKRISFGKFGN